MELAIERTFHFEAAHFLPHVPEGHKCRNIHGHSFKVTIEVAGDVDAEQGWVCDFADLSKLWEPIHLALDHKLLNDVEGLANPTSEMLVLWIARNLKLPPSTKLRSIKIHETCRSACTLRM